jgi:hypothetical protein
MGTVRVKLENLHDWNDIANGLLSPDELRSVEVTDAVVDTRVSTMLVPMPLIIRLGLRKTRTIMTRGIAGRIPMDIYGTVRLTIQEQECTLDVGANPASDGIIVGRIPLNLLDLVVDVANGRLIGNPEHGGKDIIDVFSHAFNEAV